MRVTVGLKLNWFLRGRVWRRKPKDRRGRLFNRSKRGKIVPEKPKGEVCMPTLGPGSGERKKPKGSLASSSRGAAICSGERPVTRGLTVRKIGERISVAEVKGESGTGVSFMSLT